MEKFYGFFLFHLVTSRLFGDGFEIAIRKILANTGLFRRCSKIDYTAVTEESTACVEAHLPY